MAKVQFQASTKPGTRHLRYTGTGQALTTYNNPYIVQQCGKVRGIHGASRVVGLLVWVLQHLVPDSADPRPEFLHGNHCEQQLDSSCCQWRSRGPDGSGWRWMGRRVGSNDHRPATRDHLHRLRPIDRQRRNVR